MIDTPWTIIAGRPMHLEIMLGKSVAWQFALIKLCNGTFYCRSALVDIFLDTFFPTPQVSCLHEVLRNELSPWKPSPRPVLQLRRRRRWRPSWQPRACPRPPTSARRLWPPALHPMVRIVSSFYLLFFPSLPSLVPSLVLFLTGPFHLSPVDFLSCLTPNRKL